MNELKNLDLSLLQAEVLAHLVEGKKTVTELCQMIYGVEPFDPSFEMYYARVRRAARNLKHRGLISTPLLGKEKPYRLTNHGILQMASLGIALEKRQKLIGLDEVLVFLSVAALGLSSILVPSRPDAENVVALLRAFLALSVGVALTRIWGIFRKVS